MKEEINTYRLSTRKYRSIFIWNKNNLFKHLTFFYKIYRNHSTHIQEKTLTNHTQRFLLWKIVIKVTRLYFWNLIKKTLKKFFGNTLTSNIPSVWVSRQGLFNWSISDEPTKSWVTKIVYTPRAVVRLVNILLSCIWLDGQKWMNGYIWHDLKRDVAAIYVLTNSQTLSLNNTVYLQRNNAYEWYHFKHPCFNNQTCELFFNKTKKNVWPTLWS